MPPFKHSRTLTAKKPLRHASVVCHQTPINLHAVFAFTNIVDPRNENAEEHTNVERNSAAIIRYSFATRFPATRIIANTIT